MFSNKAVRISQHCFNDIFIFCKYAVFLAFVFIIERVAGKLLIQRNIASRSGTKVFF